MDRGLTCCAHCHDHLADRDQVAEDNQRRDTAGLMALVIGVGAWFIGLFLYTSLGAGTFHVLQLEAVVDLCIAGAAGTASLVTGAWLLLRRPRPSAAPQIQPAPEAGH